MSTEIVHVEWGALEAGKAFEQVKFELERYCRTTCNVIVVAPYYSHFATLHEQFLTDPDLCKHIYVWTSDEKTAQDVLHKAVQWATVRNKRTPGAIQLENKAIFQLMRVFQERGADPSVPLIFTETRLMDLIQTLRELFVAFDEGYTMTTLMMCILHGIRRGEQQPGDYDLMVKKYCSRPDAWRIAMNITSLDQAVFSLRFGYNSCQALATTPAEATAAAASAASS